MKPRGVQELQDACQELSRLASRLDLPRIILLQKMALAMDVKLEKRVAEGSDIQGNCIKMGDLGKAA